MTTFRLQYGDTVKTFADWGITNVVFKEVSQGIDVVTFAMPSVQFEADFTFNYRDTLIVLRDDGAGNVRFFYGVVTKRGRVGSPDNEAHTYEVSNPAWHLSRIPFEMNWKFLKTGATLPLTDASYETVPLGVLLLNLVQGVPTRRSGTKAQIAAILDYAISVGVPLAYDSSQFPDVDAPIDEVRDMAMSEAIGRELRWSPNCVWWWDYSTEPYPTLHMSPRTNPLDQSLMLTAKTLNALGGERVESISLNPRNDLLLDGVILKYQTTASVDNSVLNELVVVKSPNNDVQIGPQVLVATINLEGSTTSYAQGLLNVDPVNHTDLAWWKARNPFLGKSNFSNLAIVPNSPKRSSALANEIIFGEYAEWMGGSAEADTIEASFSFTLLDDAGNVVKEITNQPYIHRCNVTNLSSGLKTSLQDFQAGEPVPTNLHTYLYEAGRVLHYEGQIVLTEDECSGEFRIGNVLNITGGRSEWETMNALIQSVTLDLDNRTTTIQIGPPEHLGYSDIIELLRTTRFRMRFTPNSARFTGQGGISGAIKMPEKVAKENTQQAPAAVDRYVIGGYVTPTNSPSAQGLIDINKTDVNGHPAKFRTLKYCEEDASGNIVNYVLEILCTEPRRVT